MASKVQERIYLEWFLSQLRLDGCRIAEADPPDFYLAHADRTLAVEITHLFKEPRPNRKGSQDKADESFKSSWLRRLAEEHYRRGGIPIHLRVNLRNLAPPENQERVLSELQRASQLQVWEERRVELRFNKQELLLLLYIRRLPESLSAYSRWTCLDDHVGFVASVTQAHILNAIAKKRGQLKSYRSKCDGAWLLLVANRLWNSGKLTLSEPICIPSDCGFESSWVLEYPVAVHKLTASSECGTTSDRGKSQ